MIDQLPDSDRDRIRGQLRAAWALTDHTLARERLDLLVGELQQRWPDAARSLREGLDETLTLMRLAITGQLAKTLASTNPSESMVRHEAPCERRTRTRRSSSVPAVMPAPGRRSSPVKLGAAVARDRALTARAAPTT